MLPVSGQTHAFCFLKNLFRVTAIGKAEFITLALNIALMGLVLSKGVFIHLKIAFAGTLNNLQFHLAAEKTAAGNFTDLLEKNPWITTLDPNGNITHDALAGGFQLLTLSRGIRVFSWHWSVSLYLSLDHRMSKWIWHIN